jgi:hypothetical protein
MPDHEMAERLYIAAALDHADARRDAVIASMSADVDRLRDSWSAGYAEQRRASEERLAAIRDETQQYLRALSTGEPTGPAPTPDLAAGDHREGASASATASSGTGHGPRQQPTPPTPQEMASAIKDMDLGSYAQLRAELGISSAASRGLFG